MASRRLGGPGPMTPPRPREEPATDVWRRHHVGTTAEMAALIEAVLEAMAGAGYAGRELHDMRLVLEEAIVNGIKHGNREDPGKRVRVSYRVAAEQVDVEVQDQGPGFDPAVVPDPLTDENLPRPSGRGLLLMRRYTTRLSYNESGNCVTFCKARSAANGAAGAS